MSLEEYLASKGVWYRFISKPRETIHTADASDLTGVDLHRLTKNLVSVTNTGENVLLIIPGDRKVNLRKASSVLGVSNVSLLPFEKAEQISGYAPGATPSVGLKTSMRVVMDTSLLQYETIYCGGGTRDRILELRTKDIVGLNDAVVSEISKAI